MSICIWLKKDESMSLLFRYVCILGLPLNIHENDDDDDIHERIGVLGMQRIKMMMVMMRFREPKRK